MFLSMKGFSLIELLIVVAILALITASGGLVLFNYANRWNLENAVVEIVALIRDAQNRSLSQQDGNGDNQGDQWGIHFENGAEDSVKVFSGSSYSSARVATTYVLRPGLKFDIPLNGQSKDVIFSRVSGLPDNPFTVKISLSGDSAIFTEIFINSNGTIQY